MAEFSPDGKTVVTCLKDETAKLWDVETGNFARTLQEADKSDYGSYEINTACFSPNGNTLAF